MSAIVLCGGRSSRMGRAKAWLPFGDEFLLQRVVRSLAEVTDPIVVVAAPGQDLPELPSDVRVVRDRREGCGPLEGLAAGLGSLPSDADAVFLTSCDVPFLKPGFVRRVIELLGSHDIAIPIHEGMPQPLAAAYRVEGLLPRVEQLLAAGKRRLLDLLPDADVRRISPEELADVDPRLESLWNINTPEQYEAALRHADLFTS